VHRDELEHVVEKADPRRYLRGAAAVEVETHLDVRFLRLARASRAASRWPSRHARR
jgi:hypothetical protein